jgi:hypothetical protein
MLLLYRDLKTPFCCIGGLENAIFCIEEGGLEKWQNEMTKKLRTMLEIIQKIRTSQYRERKIRT